MNEQGPPKQEADSELIEEIKMLKGVARANLGRDEFAERQVAFINKILEKYPKWEDYRTYHALAESSIMPGKEGDAIDDDFPGEDSILRFLQNLVS